MYWAVLSHFTISMRDLIRPVMSCTTLSICENLHLVRRIRPNIEMQPTHCDNFLLICLSYSTLILPSFTQRFQFHPGSSESPERSPGTVAPAIPDRYFSLISSVTSGVFGTTASPERRGMVNNGRIFKEPLLPFS